MNHIEGLKAHPTKRSYPYFTYRGYRLFTARDNISYVLILDPQGHLVSTEHTDVAISIIDSWLTPP